MKNWFFSEGKKRELKRAWPFLLLFGLLLGTDRGALSVIGYAVGIVALAVILAHLSRKILFPYLDVAALISEITTENNVAAAIVVAAMIGLMAAILYGIIALLR